MGKTVKFLNERAWDVYILPDARAKMEMYCELCEKEIGWLGFVKKLEGIGFMITDVMLLKQEVHATTTEIDPQALLEFWGQTPPEKQSEIKVWGHSHVNMSPTPSGQDDNQMEYFKDGNPWFIRLITNKKGDMNITIYDYESGFEVHDDKLITYYPQRTEMREKIKAEIAEKVSEKKATPVTTTPYNNTYNNKYNTWNGRRNTTKGTGAKTEPMFKDIEIKYVNKFEDALNDPNYWQDILAVGA